MQVSMIVAMAANRAIGKDNRMPWHLPADLKHFKQTTMGCPVIMGRKTFESILATLGKPLPGRANIVITRNRQFDHAGIVRVASPEAALEAALEATEQPVPAGEPLSPTLSRESPGEVFVIGGAEIYRAMLPLARRIVVTEIRHHFDGDAFFPGLDPHLWRETARRPQPESGTPPVTFDFVEYRRR
jgi:dihydrofolate reductase